MSIVLVGSTSGSCTLQEQAVAGNTVLTLPTTSGTVLTTGSSGQIIPKAALPTGSVLQVVQATKTDTFSTSSTSFTDVTGLSVSIIPTSATSQILVLVSTNGSCSGGNNYMVQLVRGNTAIFIGDAAGSRTRAAAQTRINDNLAAFTFAFNFLDSPATTSSTTYKIQGKVQAGGTAQVNRTSQDSDSADFARTASSIIVMEIAA